MANERFREFEDNFQRQYDDVEMEFKPAVVLSIKLISFRNISESFFGDLVDTPDPQFRVICPKLTDPKTRKLATSSIKSNTTSGEINQTFKFVLPETLQPGEEFPVVIELYDLDVISDDFIGRDFFDATDIPGNGAKISKTFRFGKGGQGGQLDTEICKILRTSPDCRHSVGLHPGEKEFRKKRIPIVCEAMKNILGHKRAPRNHLETPVVALVGSGGGYRAVNGMCGVTEALEDAGLMDIFTYACGLSGSAWYLTSAYTMKGMLPHERKDFHSGLRERMESSLLRDMINPFTMFEFKQHITDTRNKYDQPTTFSDYFPGFLCARQLFGKQNENKLSDMESYVRGAKIPFPLFVALHVKNNVIASKFHAYVEKSPYEVSLPSFGIGFDPKDEGSTWNNGFLVRKCPEPLITLTLAMCGCAFSIILGKFMRDGGELGSSFLRYIDRERVDGKAKKGSDPSRGIESEEDDDDEDDEEDTIDGSTSGQNNALRRSSSLATTAAMSAFTTVVPPTSPALETGELPFILNHLKGSPLLTDRGAIVGRTVRLLNFALGFENLKRFHMNPIGEIKPHGPEAREIIAKLGIEDLGQTKSLSTKKSIISVADAGILKNVPSDTVLRPQRTVDLLICMDFTGYESDDKFHYEPLLASAAHAWQSGLKFPQIDFEEITNLPPKEFLAFKSDDDDCPTVLWFTLCNKTFKNLENYIPRSTEKPTGNDGRKFNDFPVFNKGNNFSSFTFQYDKYNCDQLRELMYFNVSSHIEEIKTALVEVTEKKRRRLAKMGFN